MINVEKIEPKNDRKNPGENILPTKIDTIIGLKIEI